MALNSGCLKRISVLSAPGIDIGAVVHKKTDGGFIVVFRGGCQENIAIKPALGIDIGATA